MRRIASPATSKATVPTTLNSTWSLREAAAGMKAISALASDMILGTILSNSAVGHPFGGTPSELGEEDERIGEHGPDRSLVADGEVVTAHEAVDLGEGQVVQLAVARTAGDHGVLCGSEGIVQRERIVTDGIEHLADLGDGHAPHLDQRPNELHPPHMRVVIVSLVDSGRGACREQTFAEVVLHRCDWGTCPLAQLCDLHA